MYIKKALYLLVMVLLMQCLLVFAQNNLLIKKKMLKKQERFYNQDSAKEINISSLNNLQKYIDVALKRNPEIKSKFYNWQSKFENISKEFSLSDPEFSYTNYIEEVETRVGPQRHAYSIYTKNSFS